MTRATFPYVTPEMIGPAEAITVSLIVSEFPELAWLATLSKGEFNATVLALICQIVNHLTGAQPTV